MTESPQALFAGVDLGGTNFTAALGDAEGNLSTEDRQLTLAHEGPAAVLKRIAAAVEKLSAAAGRRPAAVGLGVPGLVDFATGETLFLPNLPTQWRGVPVVAYLTQKLGCPVYLLNDARAATLGESMFGLGRGVQTMALFTLGTGVGGGIVIDGRLRLGPLGAAGEIGHICVQPGGLLCGCGCSGCLETIASGPALTKEGVRIMEIGQAPILREICGGDPARVSPEALGAAARAGDAGALGVLEHAGNLIGLAASAVVLALHPELIVLGGRVASLGDFLIEPMRRSIAEHVRMFPVEGIRIARSQLGDLAGVYGGLAVAVCGGVLQTVGGNSR
ncbi:MAG TPA: ROK family protein [Opitutaceae bacterium]